MTLHEDGYPSPQRPIEELNEYTTVYCPDTGRRVMSVFNVPDREMCEVKVFGSDGNPFMSMFIDDQHVESLAQALITYKNYYRTS